MKQLEVKNLSFSYDESTHAVRHVSFAIEKGSYTTIIGHNGSGKSTIAKLLIGLLEKDEGEILIDDLPLNEENLMEIRSRVGIVFQNPDNQFIGSTVRDDIAFGLENHCVEQSKMDAIITEFAEKVNMSEYLESEPTRLSGGQKQRVAIAGVIAMMPRCVIFDEPTAMLDPSGRKEVMRVIRDLNSRLGITVVLITHHMDEAVQAGRVVVMHAGKVLMQGTPREIFTQVDALREASLTVPQTIEVLFDLNNQIGSDLPIDALTVDECADILEGYLRPTAAN